MAQDDRSSDLWVSTLLCLGVAALTVALRCYVRISMVKSFFAEDGLAVVTMAFFALYCSCILCSIKHGAGKHMQDVPEDDLLEGLKMRWLGELAYILTSVFLKATVAMFLQPICSQRWQKLVIFFVTMVVIIFNGGYFILAAFQCAPVDFFWTRLYPSQEGACLGESLITGTTYAASAINACGDWVLSLLPIALVWHLELSTKNKISIVGVLALGVLASTATLVRIPYVWQLTHDDDILYVITDFTIWGTVENGVGLAASSIATMRPLFKKVLDATTTSSPMIPLDDRRRARHQRWSKLTPPPSRRGSNAQARSWWDQPQYQGSPPVTPVTPPTHSAGRTTWPSRAERLAIAPWERYDEPADTGYSYRITAHR